MLELNTITFWFMTESGEVKYRAHTGEAIHRAQQQGQMDKAITEFDYASGVVALSFTFANCANVKLDDMTAEFASKPRIQRLLRIPTVKWYTLNICGHSTVRRIGQATDGWQGIMPLHLCRGRHVEYTAERPRFGRLKDGVGRFFISPHMRGKKENGEIHKDYNVKGD